MIRKFVENRINPILRKFGGAITPAHKEVSLPASLGRIRQKNIVVNTVIDIGASYGKWAQTVMPYFPKANYLLVEAQQIHLQKLEKFVARHHNARFVLAAAGRQPGEIYFDASDPLGGLASERKIEGPGKKIITVPVTTIDLEVENRQLGGPYLVKLDTHGFELPILEGAEKTLQSASVVIIEAYNFVIADEAIRFHEMIAHMEKRGFRMADMCDPMFRLSDGMLWQMDLVFIRDSHPAFSNPSF